MSYFNSGDTARRVNEKTFVELIEDCDRGSPRNKSIVPARLSLFSFENFFFFLFFFLPNSTLNPRTLNLETKEREESMRNEQIETLLINSRIGPLS